MHFKSIVNPKFLVSCVIICLMSNVVTAEEVTRAGSISINNWSWSDKSKTENDKQNSNFIGLEGRAQSNWGDIFGFYNTFNFDKSPDQSQSEMKIAINKYMGTTPFSLYTHIFNFSSFGFSEQNRIIGVAYQTGGTWGFLHSYIGHHQVVNTFYSGENGEQFGLTLGVPFGLLNQAFSILYWHEYEFNRNKQYAVRCARTFLTHADSNEFQDQNVC